MVNHSFCSLLQTRVNFKGLDDFEQIFVTFKKQLPIEESRVCLAFKSDRGNVFWVCELFINNKFIFLHFPEYAFVCIMDPLRAVHDQIPFTARPYLHFYYRISKAVWAPPILNMFGLCPYFPDKIDWCFNYSREN